MTHHFLHQFPLLAGRLLQHQQHCHILLAAHKQLAALHLIVHHRSRRRLVWIGPIVLSTLDEILETRARRRRPSAEHLGRIGAGRRQQIESASGRCVPTGKSARPLVRHGEHRQLGHERCQLDAGQLFALLLRRIKDVGRVHEVRGYWLAGWVGGGLIERERFERKAQRHAILGGGRHWVAVRR